MHHGPLLLPGQAFGGVLTMSGIKKFYDSLHIFKGEMGVSM